MASNPPTRNLKQTPIPVVPRQVKLVNPDGTPTRSGQLLLEQQQRPSATEGTHSGRPDPTQATDGALYTEADRGVLYFNNGGKWLYLAGTMWGTLNPDQRPTDLGPNDAGFHFEVVTSDTANAGREFIWSGSAWVEATEVLWGGHTGRLALGINQVNGELYVEADRGGVIYQLQQGKAWHYLAGAMWGTLSPDQRPTDLGANDSGFTFRTTVSPAQTFMWNGGQWVETTPIRYGTHAARLAAPVTYMVSGMLWMETDRGNVIYQNQAGTWLYLTGTMWGTLSPDQRPTDLGVNDDGFTFLATTTPLRTFIWANPSWVETTPPPPITVQNVVTGSRAYGAVYQNTGTTPRFVSVSPQFQVSTGGLLQQVQAYVDVVNPPVTVVASSYVEISVSTFVLYTGIPLFFIVLPQNYYKVVATGGSLGIYQWTEWN